MALDDPVVILIFIPLLIIAFVAILVFVVVKVAKTAWREGQRGSMSVPPNAQTAGTKFCTKCGGRVPEGSKFCNNCGAPIG